MKYAPLSGVILEWKRTSQEESEIKETDLLAYAEDAVERILTADMLVMGIALLRVHNFKAELPKGFQSVAIAMYSNEEKKCTREEVVEWTQQLYGSNCSLRINLECHECGSKHACSCNNRESTAVLVDVDRIYQGSHPGYNLQGTNTRHSSFTTSSYNCPEGIKRFRLMRATVNDMFNAKHHVKGCPNININSKVEYKIRDGLIEVNFQEGEILLSYLSYAIDDKGYMMIPDHPLAYKAVVSYIEERLAYVAYRKSRSGADGNFYNMALSLKDKDIARAKSRLSIPDPDVWYEIIKTHWLKMIPNWYSDHSFNGAKQDAYRPYKV